MLLSLHLSNYALFENAEIEFGTHFNAVTGESGAGKSLVLSALALVLGARQADMVRFGKDSACVSAVFASDTANTWLDAHGFSIDDEIIIKRQIGARKKAWVNGAPIGLTQLRELGQILVSMSTQHAQMALSESRFAIDWLDKAGELSAQKEHVSELFAIYARQKSAFENQQKAQQMRDATKLLLAQYLDEYQPLHGIDIDTISDEYDALSNFEALAHSANSAIAMLDDENGVHDLLARIQKSLSAHSNHFAGALDALANALDAVAIARGELLAHSEQNFDEARLQALDALLALSFRLAKKHGVSASELANKAAQWTQELAELDAPMLDEKIVQMAYHDFEKQAQALHIQRTSASTVLAKKLEQHLHELGLPDAKVQFVFMPSAPSKDGLYDTQLLFSANAGFAPQPISKVASGGERSRVALTLHLLAKDEVDTMIFDEIDVGLSGAAADKIGALLHSLGKHTQIVSITHQAQVAARADHHILVQKNADTSFATLLDDDLRVDEIARISGGSTITDATRAHAKSLLGVSS